MPTATGLQLANSANKSFQENVVAGMLLEANAQLALGAVAPGASGYSAYKKRMDLATSVINNPKVHAEAFGKQILLVDVNKVNETDSTVLQADIQGAQIWDKVAGVNQQDLV